jgi:hypothetical protein
MARRNIAKTAIEGGRATQCRSAEREEDLKERRAYRDYCRVALLDEDLDEPGTGRGSSWDTGRRSREFDDRLNPVKRWLEAQVGRPWDKVKSDVVAKFNGRTLAGRHILGHVDGFVDKPEDKFLYGRRGWSRRYPGELYIDGRGVLRQVPVMTKEKFYSKK